MKPKPRKSRHGEVLLNVADLCRLLQVPPATIYQLTHRGRVPHFKIANRLRFRGSEILEWIEERRVRKLTRPRTSNRLTPPE